MSVSSSRALGQALQTARTSKGKTREEVAHATSIPSADFLNDVEKGRLDIKAGHLISVLKFLGQSITLGGKQYVGSVDG